jgi:hypothetical protein
LNLDKCQLDIATEVRFARLHYWEKEGDEEMVNYLRDWDLASFLKYDPTFMSEILEYARRLREGLDVD